jgi:hypothetical protein
MTDEHRDDPNCMCFECRNRIGEKIDNITVHVCYGPGSPKCKCRCPDGPCEHVWDGPTWTSEDGRASSATCGRCGMIAMDHDMWVLP